MTYARITSTLAILIALAAGADAKFHVGPNSVGSKQLKKRAVVTSKVAPNAVNGAKIKDGSLGTPDVSDDPNTIGPKGPPGDPAPAALRFVAYYTYDYAIPDGYHASAGVGCSMAAPKLIGGGVRLTGAGRTAFQLQSYPATNNAWRASGDNNTGQQQTMTVFSICAAGT